MQSIGYSTPLSISISILNYPNTQSAVALQRQDARNENTFHYRKKSLERRVSVMMGSRDNHAMVEHLIPCRLCRYACRCF